ncbi:MAG: sodium-dependent bicarbonate transport family permease [Candidatus Hydrogenedentes bacterium]|nr:sodium-dependent bicarbonate transport family permease [Candidatus Hydrogenedentota bacterium]
MNLDLVLANLLSAPILFFFLGVAASLVRSDLNIAQPVAHFLSLYLLLSIGFKGGVELSHSGLGPAVLVVLVVAIIAAFAIPIWSFFILRRKLSVEDAGAVAACYGSISAVTFITAISFLNQTHEPFSGFMVACMALMESPAIISGVLLVRYMGHSEGQQAAWRSLLHEALFNGAVVVLIGSLVIGYITGDHGWQEMEPLVGTPFKAVLAVFLLDMGLVAAKRLHHLRRTGPFLIGFGIVIPVLHAALGITVAHFLGLSPGDALLMAVLFGSASYIAVPAAMRIAIPQSNPGIFLPMSLGVTFPFNIIVGIPLYMGFINLWW